MPETAQVIDDNGQITEGVLLDPDGDEPFSTQRAIDELCDALKDSDNTSCSVHRQPASGKNPLEYIFSYAPEEMTYTEMLEHVKTSHGGGRYRIHVREGNKLRANKGFAIAITEETPVKRNDVAVADPMKPQNIMEMMQTMHNQNTQMMREFMENMKPAAPANQLTDFMGMMGMMGQMKGAFFH